MRIAFLALSAQLGCILAAALQNVVVPEVEEPQVDFDEVAQMLQTAKRLGTGDLGGFRRLWGRRSGRESDLGCFGDRAGVDHFKTDDEYHYEGSFCVFFPEACPDGSPLAKRDAQKEAAMAPLVKRQASANDEIEEEHVLALIVKNQYEEVDNCKGELEKYCKELEDANSTLGKLGSEVKGLCGDSDKKKKCETLKAKIDKKIDNLKEVEKKLATLKDEECIKYELECMFLEGADSSKLGDVCSKLRSQCYKRKREDVAEELLFRALEGENVTDETECQEKVKEVCPTLSEESDELMLLCLDPKKTCEALKKKKDVVCKPLEDELKDELQEKCQERLEKCHFYEKSCSNDDVKKGCDESREKCKKENITYKPPGSDFSPIEPEATLLERIGLEEVYKRAKGQGIIVGRTGGKSLREIVLLLSSLETTKNEAEEKCTEALKNKCDTSEYLSTELKTLCADSNGRDEKCKNLVYVKDKCRDLKLNLYLKGLSTKFEDGKDSDVFSWSQLPRLLTEQECLVFESQCFYLEAMCGDVKIKKACENVRSECYRKGKDRALNQLLQNGLHQRLQGLKSSTGGLEECQKIVVENCTKLVVNKEYLVRCVDPERLCTELEDDVSMQLEELRQVLDQVRDLPANKYCVELKEKCQHLKKHSYMNHERCATLNRRCEYLETSFELNAELLKRNSDVLRNEENCTKALKEECSQLSRRGDNPFSVSCVFPKETCQFMIEMTQGYCYALEENMESHKVVENLNGNGNVNETLLEEICTLWGPYCDQLMENCPDTLKENEKNKAEKKNCSKLKEKCDPLKEKKKLEDILAHELKGNLGNEDKCKETLEKYCTVLGKSSNDTLKDLCGTKDNNNDAQGKVCKKLVKRIKEKCPTLEKDLTKAKDKLEKKTKKFNEVKKEAKESMDKAKLLLSKAKNGNKKNAAQDGTKSPPAAAAPAPPAPASPPASPVPAGTAGDAKNATGSTTDTGAATNTTTHRLVRRANVLVQVSEEEAKAFDFAAMAMDLYLELKKECEALRYECDFREDCEECKTLCEKIDTLCGEVKPLDVTPHHTETTTTTQVSTTTTTTTATTTETTTKTESMKGKVTEECTSIRTTDTWVTSTSFHTSTTTSTSTVTSTVTLTSTRKCKPTKCTTDSSKETEKEEEVRPNEGVKMGVSEMMKMMLLGVIIIGMI